MHFMNSHPDVVRSASQRRLLSYRDRQRGTIPLPTWEGVEAEELVAVAESVSFQDVVGDEGDARFLIRYHGKRIAEAYGSFCQGKFLDETTSLEGAFDNRDVLKSLPKPAGFALCTTIQP